MFIVSDKYEWYDKNALKALVSNYDKYVLALCHWPPVNLNDDNLFTYN